MKAGERIGPYVVEAPLGQGSMGSVYRVRREADGAELALKVLAAELAGDEDALRRLSVEVRALAEVEGHPHIVPVVDVGATRSGRPYVVMELVPGGTLRAALRTGLPLERGLDLLEQVALALEHVHRQGILHRDVKPANVLIDARGDARLSDFGLARRLHISDRLTQTGELVGTPAYMAPEQVEESLGPQGPATDVYALGVILYELLCGRQPFEGSTLLDVFRRIVQGSPEPPSARAAGVPPALEALCLAALEVDPMLRPPTAGAFHQALVEARSAAPRRLRERGVVVGAVVAAGLAVGAAVSGAMWADREVSPSPAATAASASPAAPGDAVAAARRGDLKAALRVVNEARREARLAAWAGDRARWEVALARVEGAERAALAWELWPQVGGAPPAAVDLIARPAQVWERIAQGEAALCAGALALAGLAFQDVSSDLPRARVAACLGLARVAVAQGELARAFEHLERALTAAIDPWLRLRCFAIGAPVARAALALGRGRERAQAFLDAADREAPRLRMPATEVARARAEARGGYPRVRGRLERWVADRVVPDLWATQSFLRAELLACSRGADGPPGLLLARAAELARCAEIGNDVRGAQRALGLLDTAEAFRRESPLLFRVRSVAARVLRDAARAETSADRAATLSPSDPLALYHRGLARLATLEGTPGERDAATFLARVRACALKRPFTGEPVLEQRLERADRLLERARTLAEERGHARLSSSATFALGRLIRIRAQVRAFAGRPVDDLAARSEALLRPLLGRIDAGRLADLERRYAQALERNSNAEMLAADRALRAERRRVGALRIRSATALYLLSGLGPRRSVDLEACMFLLGGAPARALAWTRAAEVTPSNRSYRSTAVALGLSLPPARVLARRLAPLGWYVKPGNLGDLAHRQPDVVPLAVTDLRAQPAAERARHAERVAAAAGGAETSSSLFLLGRALLLLGSPVGPAGASDRRRAVVDLTRVLASSSGLGVAHLLRAAAQTGGGSVTPPEVAAEIAFDLSCARAERPWSRAVVLAGLALAPAEGLSDWALDANALGVSTGSAFPFATPARARALARRFGAARAHLRRPGVTRSEAYTADLPEFDLARLLLAAAGSARHAKAVRESWFRSLRGRPNLEASFRAALSEARPAAERLEAGLRAVWRSWPGGRMFSLHPALVRQEQALDVGMKGEYARFSADHGQLFALHFAAEGLQLLTKLVRAPRGWSTAVTFPVGVEQLEVQGLQLHRTQERLAAYYFREGRPRRALVCMERALSADPEPIQSLETLRSWMLRERRGAFAAMAVETRRRSYRALAGLAQRVAATVAPRDRGAARRIECDAHVAHAGEQEGAERRAALERARACLGRLNGAEAALRHLRVHLALGNATEAERAAAALRGAIRRRPALRGEIRRVIAGDPLRPERAPLMKALLAEDGS